MNMWKLAMSGSSKIAGNVDEAAIAAPSEQAEAAAQHAAALANPLLAGFLRLHTPHLKERTEL